MKVDPCLDCGRLCFRKDNELSPDRCIYCGGKLLKANPRTGRSEAHPEMSRRLIREWEGAS